MINVSTFMFNTYYTRSNFLTLIFQRQKITLRVVDNKKDFLFYITPNSFEESLGFREDHIHEGSTNQASSDKPLSNSFRHMYRPQSVRHRA